MKDHTPNLLAADDNGELLPLVDGQGNVLGSATRRECHNGTKLLHPVVHLHLFDTQGRLYLQKRPEWKLIQPGKWDTAVGGHVAYGEAVYDALLRETAEEIGLTDFSPEHLLTYLFESDRERELVYVYRTITDTTPAPGTELAGGRFFTIRDLHEAAAQGVLTPNFVEETQRLGWL